MSAAWMPRPSPHGRVYGVPRAVTPPHPDPENPEPTNPGSALHALAVETAAPAAGQLQPNNPRCAAARLPPTDLG
ncbi:hypothetical protein DCO49_14950 [Stenotrophomonas sp. SPM]|nr:hypothetical protein DCO49_14950 [Stenotrophomonas sp. SPM]